MSAALHDPAAVTYIASDADSADVIDLVTVLQRRGTRVAAQRPALVSPDGRRLPLPEPIYDALLHIADALAHGQGVTVAPHDALLTTQEAADLLGVSRPTLVRLLEDGEIPHTMRGRHRRVALADVVAYQQRRHVDRKEALARMVRDAEGAGLYEATLPPARATR
jgi:excisionase family DNA binding protein